MKFPRLAVLGFGLFAGCATIPATRTLTPLDSGHEFGMKVGDVLVVELPANRTTGYGWADRSVGQVVEPVGATEYLQDSQGGWVGAGGTEIRRFRAAKAGRETLRLEYARAWEIGTAPVKTVSFDLVVAP